jgi:hypothetical protein
MASYRFDLFKAGLLLTDTPLGYTPPFGPAVAFRFTDNQRGEQSFDDTTSSVGPKWTLNWLSYAQQSDSAGNVALFNPAGTLETHSVSTEQTTFVRKRRGLSVIEIAPDGA